MNWFILQKGPNYKGLLTVSVFEHKEILNIRTWNKLLWTKYKTNG